MKTNKENIATLTIKSCKECPHFDEVRTHTADSFELVFNWLCKKKENKTIAKEIGWTTSEQNRVKIPNWCPLIIKK